MADLWNTWTVGNAPFGTGSPAEEAQKPSGLAWLASLLPQAAQPQAAPQVVYPTANPLTAITDQDLNRGMDLAMGFSGGGLTTKPIKAYHGSPHDFERFDLSKIGTGEGAQAYGHGLYFAENPAVSEAYKTSVTRNPEQLADIARSHGLTGDAAEMLAHQFSTGFGGKRFDDWLTGLKGAIDDPLLSPRVKAAAQQMLDKSVEAADAFAKMKAPGKMYEVNIKADPEHFLDWDKPLHQQPAIAQKLGWTPEELASYQASRKTADNDLLAALTGDKELAGDFAAMVNGTPPMNGRPRLDQTGQDIAYGRSGVASVFDQPSNVERMAKLREAGIPGIKYLDQGSRTAGEGSRNYVVFDDKLIDILKKYGLVGAFAPPVLSAASNGEFPFYQGGR